MRLQAEREEQQRRPDIELGSARRLLDAVDFVKARAAVVRALEIFPEVQGGLGLLEAIDESEKSHAAKLELERRINSLFVEARAFQKADG